MACGGRSTAPCAARVERVEPPRVFAYRWASRTEVEPEEGTSTLVEFFLEPDARGTRLRVVESGFAALDVPVDEQERKAKGNVDGWDHELRDLAEYARSEVAARRDRRAPRRRSSPRWPTRRAGACSRLLAERGDGTATTLAGELPVSRPAVIKHLAVLDRAGLVEARRRGPRGPLHRPPRAPRRRPRADLAGLAAAVGRAAGRDQADGGGGLTAPTRQPPPAPPGAPGR